MSCMINNTWKNTNYLVANLTSNYIEKLYLLHPTKISENNTNTSILVILMLYILYNPTNIHNSFSWILNIFLFLQDNMTSPFEKIFRFNIFVH